MDHFLHDLSYGLKSLQDAAVDLDPHHRDEAPEPRTESINRRTRTWWD
jgi:hypothetical protein